MTLRTERVGREWQVVVEGLADLPGVLELEDARWVATAAPVSTLQADRVLLTDLDADGDGRIRSDDVRRAIRELAEDLTDIRDAADPLPLSAIAADGPRGSAILAAARRVVADADSVGLAEVRAFRAAEEAKGLSEAGRVLPVAAAEGSPTRTLLDTVIAITGGEPHPAGKAVSAATLDRFLDEARRWLAWWDAGAADPTRLAAGDATAAAVAAVEAVAAKVDQYLLLCEATVVDPRVAAHALPSLDGDLLDAAQADALLDKAPLGPPTPACALRPDGVTNPRWRAAVTRLWDDGLVPVLGERDALDRADWTTLRARLAPWRRHADAEPETAAGALGPDRLRALVDDAASIAAARGLLAASEERARVLADVHRVERLLVRCTGLLPLVRSFVCMPDLFAPDTRALFERGRLILDGREFDLAVPVLDRARSEMFGQRSPLFVMYVEIGATAGALDREVAVPVTAGVRGDLVEGMWGVFESVEGPLLHARIRKLAPSPISIREALLAPLSRLYDVVQRAADAAAADRTKEVDAQLATGANQAVATATTLPPPPPAPAPPSAAVPATTDPRWQGLPMLLVGGGVAVAAIGSSLTYVADRLGTASAGVAGWLLATAHLTELAAGPGGGALTAAANILGAALVLLGVLAVPLVAYAIPMAIATWLRLRRRDLATLLDGAGWAVNRRMFLTREQALHYTRER